MKDLVAEHVERCRNLTPDQVIALEDAWGSKVSPWNAKGWEPTKEGPWWDAWADVMDVEGPTRSLHSISPATLLVSNYQKSIVRLLTIE